MKMIIVNIVLFVGLASAAANSGAQSSYKARRGGTVGLFPFPRVGRSQFEKTWQLSPEEYAEFHSEAKRQGLIPFPRTGRSNGGLGGAAGPRWGANGDASAGMWFGPRLGKLSKRGDLAPWTMIALREMTNQRDFTPRLGRESEELQNAEEELEQEAAEEESSRTV